MPQCSQAIKTAHKPAFENDLISAELIDIGAFLHLAGKYQLRGIPKVVINEKEHFEGALPGAQFVDRLLHA